MESKEQKNAKSVIRHFSPAWYASVMGTGGLANALFMFGNQAEWLRPAAVALFWLNVALFIVFIVPWTLRWVLHFDRLREDLRHPIMSNFFVTMPVGAIVLGTNFLSIGRAFFARPFIGGLSLVLWIVSVVLILFFGVYVVYTMLLKENLQPEQVNFSWFITPVASVVVPLLGNPLAKMWMGIDPNTAKLINLLDIGFFGIGLFLFLIIGAVVFNSLLHHKMPHASMAPTFWILLGPIGVGTLSLLGIADVSKGLGMLVDTSGLQLIALALWGFGLWAFALTIAVTIKYLRGGGIPFTLSWWAFIFPLGAYTLASYAVFGLLQLPVVFWYAALLLIILVSLWLATAVRSLIALFGGGLLVPKAPQGPAQKGPAKA